MWLFGYKSTGKRGGGSKKSSHPAAVVYAVSAADAIDTILTLHADAHAAIVEASKLELASDGVRPHVVREIEVLPPVQSDLCTVDLEARLGLEDLPPVARAFVEERRAAEVHRLVERVDRVRAVADAIRDPWRALKSEFNEKEARCTAAKEAAAKSYVRDRGMSAARVREICDANDMALQISRDVLRDRGEKLVRTTIGRASSVTLDDVISVMQ